MVMCGDGEELLAPRGRNVAYWLAWGVGAGWCIWGFNALSQPLGGGRPELE